MSNRRMHLERAVPYLPNHTPELWHLSALVSQLPADAPPIALPSEPAKTNIQQSLQLLDTLPPSDAPGIRGLLRICLSEALAQQTLEDQVLFLFWHLSSMKSEFQKLPITHGGYTVDLQGTHVRLLDLRYTQNPDVLKISEKETGDPKYDARYKKETEQIKHITTWLASLLPLPPTPDNLCQAGWRLSARTLTSEAACKLELHKKTPLVLGPKALYCMPSTSVHEGGMSVLVVIQPAYVPNQNKFVLLHDQQMLKLSHTDAMTILSQLGSRTTAEVLQHQAMGKLMSPDEVESVIMQAFAILPSETQLQTATEVFKKLLSTFSLIAQFQQFFTLRKLSRSEQSVQYLARYVIDVVAQEIAQQPLTTQKILFLEQFFQEVLIKALFGNEPLSPTKLQLLQSIHQNLKNASFADIHSSIGLILPSVFKQFNLSGLDCLVGLTRPFSAIGKQSNTLLQSMQSGFVTQPQLKEIIGKERADSWSKGFCKLKQSCKQKALFHVNPLTHTTWIGECGICLWCEQNMPTKSIGEKSETSSIVYSQPISRATTTINSIPTTQYLDLPPASLTSFLASIV